MEMIKFSLEACRKNVGMSLKDASGYVGINYQTLSKYEHDSSNIPMSLFNKLSVLYSVPTEYIFLVKRDELIQTLRSTQPEG